jgi:uncharacterized protein (TIGR02246 family)
MASAMLSESPWNAARLRAAACVALLALAGCTRGPAGADVAGVEAVSAAWKSAFNAADMAAVVALYADDAVLSAPGEPVVRGRPALASYFAKKGAEFARTGLTVQDVPMGIEGASGDLGYQWKTYRITDKSGAVAGTGRLLTLFQRRDGRWLILADTWNPDPAAVAPLQPR